MAKKFLSFTALILALTIALLSFTACGNSKKDDDDEEYSMSDFKKNLEKAEYTARITEDEEEIRELFEDIELDYSDYKIEKMLIAFSTQLPESLSIIECNSKSSAKKCKNDVEEAYNKLFQDLASDGNQTLLYIDFEYEVHDCFVFVGTKSAIKSALETSKNNPDDDDNGGNFGIGGEIVESSLSFYRTNLQNAGYTVYDYTDEDIDVMIEESDLSGDKDDYRIVAALGAALANTGSAISVETVTIFECSTVAAANRLKTDISKSYNNSNTGSILNFKFKLLGKFVLMGTEKALEAAQELPIVTPGGADLSQTSLSEIEEKLRKSSYSVYYVKDTERIKEAILDLDLEPKLYNVKTIFGAQNSSGKRIVVFECNSSADVKDLAEDINYPDKLETMFSNTTPKTLEVRGNLLIIGDNEAVTALK